MEITKEMLYTASQAANHQQLRVMYDAMKAERDALSAQVFGLTDEITKSADAILERMPPDEIHSIACSMLETAKATTQHHLRQVRAAAGRAGFIAGYMLCNDDSSLIKHNYEGFANQYHASILAGKE